MTLCDTCERKNVACSLRAEAGHSKVSTEAIEGVIGKLHMASQIGLVEATRDEPGEG